MWRDLLQAAQARQLPSLSPPHPL